MHYKKYAFKKHAVQIVCATEHRRDISTRYKTYDLQNVGFTKRTHYKTNALQNERVKTNALQNERVTKRTRYKMYAFKKVRVTKRTNFKKFSLKNSGV